MPPERYDLVVIGGGIHGVGVAQASAARGYRTLVLERDRLAAGTSSRSSKLIHGGLRYLAQFQLSLVKTSLRERETLLRIAPQLVKRVDFHVPVYGNSRYGSLRLHAGLSLYAFLAGFGDHAQFSRLDPDELAGLDGLSTEGLKTVYRYPDAQTDDVELTQAVMRSAKQLGAELRCPAHFTGARRDGGSYVIEFESGEGERERVVAATVVKRGGTVDRRGARSVRASPGDPPV
ncbi:MAG: FAD-dependent oxidoreductase [Planctomycetota bacterium]